MRVFLAFLVALASFGLPLKAGPALAAPPASSFEDVSSAYWAAGYIDFVAEKGIMHGYSETTFGPEASLTRAEAVKLVLGALGITPAGLTAATPVTPHFPDVTSKHSLFAYVEEALDRKIVSGYEDNTFKPDRPVTRAEFVKILIGAADERDDTISTKDEIFSDVTNQWYAKYVYSAAQRNYISGFDDGTFKPDLTITRSQAAKIIALFVNKGVLPDFAIPENSIEETKMLERINTSRTELEKSPLTLSARLSLIARNHSQELVDQFKDIDKVEWEEEHPDTQPPWIAHTDAAGKNFETRFRTAASHIGVDYKVASENVAWATFRSRTLDEALAAMHTEMMDLPIADTAAHANQKSNLLSQFTPFTDVGIGIVVNPDTQEITMTQVFIEK